MLAARAYATNGLGTAYGNEIQFTTIASAPTVKTTDVTNILTTTATSGGDVTSDGGSAVTARGVVWSTSPTPTISLTTKTSNSSGTGLFSSSLISLLPVTKYYVRAYATNSSGTFYGSETSFTTLASTPTVETTDVTNILKTTATSGGDVTSDGGSAVTARGVVWSTSTAPIITLTTKTSNSKDTGQFISSLTSLVAGTKYYVRAYATNSIGTSYGDEKTFTTLDNLPKLVTDAVTYITSSSGIVNGNVTADEGYPILQKGIVWDLNSGPTINSNLGKAVGTAGLGVIQFSLSALSVATKYYVRAYATNSIGTAYGNEVTFTTLSGLAVLTTANASAITNSSALLGGAVVNEGGVEVTEKGIVISTLTGPTVLNSKQSAGAGKGAFTTTVVDLIKGKKFYVRTYAINSFGTSYGPEITFTTLP